MPHHIGASLCAWRGFTESRVYALWQEARLAARLRVRFGDNHTHGEHVGACKSVRLELHRPPSALAAAQEPLCSIVGSAQVSYVTARARERFCFSTRVPPCLHARVMHAITA